MSTDFPLGPERDLRGYADQPPQFEWPGGARLAVNFVINFEEGAERSALDGDTEREPLVEAHYDVPTGERELFQESTFEYGARVGIWRLIETFAAHGVTPSIFACGLALERSPDATARLVGMGCDFIGHGYRWIPHTRMTRDQQRDDIRRCINSVRACTGQPVRGWFTRPPSTVHTRELLAEEGLLYDCDAVNDDLPYFVTARERPFLVVPYSLDVNDTKFFKNQFFTGRDFADYATDAFDLLYRESVRVPRMMSIGLHSRIIGRPGRLGGLLRLLEHVCDREGVLITTRNAIAEFWIDAFGPSTAVDPAGQSA